MNGEWKPGDVAVVNDTTNDSAPWLIAICRASATADCEARWATRLGEVWSSVNKARPVVVIDPENEGDVDRVADAIRGHGSAVLGREVDWLGIQAALRELAAPAHPAEPEPTVTPAEARAMRTALARLDREEGRR